MSDGMDIRWKQRFGNLDRAYTLLRSALEEKRPDQLSELEQEGVIQRFEYTYELAWKTMKDYLEENGIVLEEITPRTVIKESFAAKIIPDGQVWIDMLLHRNLLSHTYDSRVFKTVLESIHSHYIPALGQLHDWLRERKDTP
jgi:nucleotidyltransferase substrate binding protein (TIGR01987 family)